MEKSSSSDSELYKTLWKAADALRSNMDAAEYKHVVLGLIFLKYISDSFSEKYRTLQNEKYADPEDKDEYIADNIFWVPSEARWSYLQKHAKQSEIGKLIDNAMDLIEKDNPSLKGILPKRYARPELNKRKLQALIMPGGVKVGNTKIYPVFAKQQHSKKCKKQNYILTPGRYVGIPEEEDDGISFEEKMKKLTTELAEQMKEEKRLNALIEENLNKIRGDKTK